MRATTRRPGRAAAYAATALCLLALCLLRPAAARAQWATPTPPGSPNDITNTNTGNVGIGTSAPSSKLEVRGAGSRNTVTLSGDGDTVGYTGLRFNALTTTNIPNNRTSAFVLSMRKDTWYGGDGSGPSFIIETGTKGGGFAAPFLITPTNDVILNGGKGAGGPAGYVPAYGNVGVGTTSPAYTFDVTSGGQWAARFRKTDSTHGGIIVEAATGYNPNVALSSGGAVKWYMNSNVASGDALQFWEATGSFPRFTLTQSGAVGIGTASPGAAYKLDVAGSVNASGLCLNGSCKGSWSEVGGGSQWTPVGTSGAITYGAGSVGVGTPSPLRGLHVAGANFTAGAELILENTSMPANGRKLNIWGNSTAGSAGRFYLRLLNDAATNSTMDFLAFDNATGGVGVGVTAPAARLHVAGGGRMDGPSGRLYLGTAAVQGARGLELVEENATTFSLRHHDPMVAWQNIAINPHGGKVGVGTANPLGPLSVGDSSVDGSDGFVVFGKKQGGSTRHYRVGFDANFNFVIGDYGGSNTAGPWTSPFAINWQAPSGSLYVNAAGSVGLGTASPGAAYRLDVAGSVNASGLCLNGSCKGSWSEVGGGTSQWGSGANSSINYSSGNVGIGTGTAAPAARLHIISADDTVAPALSVRQDTNPLFGFDLTLDTNVNGNLSFNRVNNGASAGMLTLERATGRVGVGTSSPKELLDVGGAGEVKARVAGSTSAAVQLQEANGAATWSEWQQYLDRLRLNTHDGVTTRPDVMSILPNGNVGIGKAAPTVALDVEGSIKATGSVSATYQDVAEWVPSTQRLAAGTVVVLDTGRSNHVLASAGAYDTKVAGVVSAQPGLILGVSGEDKVMVATTGRVKVKVDATRGPIKVGDLLVTSEVEGVAMKSVPFDLGGTAIHRPGTIIGKALEPLAGGKGEILVLLSLQ